MHRPGRRGHIAREPRSFYRLYSDDVAYMAGSRTWERTVSNLFVPHNTHIVPAWRLVTTTPDARLGPRVTDALLATVVGQVPADWLGGEERRGDYVAYLRDRLAAPRAFAAEAEEARARA